MRGTQHWCGFDLPAGGIIPAYAGNTCDPKYLRRSHGDHPRVCGEHYARRNPNTRFKGSSPRMRGTLRVPCRGQIGVGIIPAYAGNTDACQGPEFNLRDHPRVCGEHFFSAFCSCPAKGSSPRMRGTHAENVECGQHRRIIPAYAGNTRYPMSHGTLHRDHPRVCGEHRAKLRRAKRA